MCIYLIVYIHIHVLNNQDNMNSNYEANSTVALKGRGVNIYYLAKAT